MVWVAFIGAAVAVREGKHITIDVLSRWITGAGKVPVQAISCFFSAAICGLLTLAAVKFVIFEAQMGTTVFFELPVWIPELIIPITFGLMTIRFTAIFLNVISVTLPRTHRK